MFLPRRIPITLTIIDENTMDLEVSDLFSHLKAASALP